MQTASAATPFLAPSGHHHLRWLICLLLAFAFGLADAAIVGLYASVLSAAEVFGGALTFGLVSLGLVITVWRLDK